MDFQHGIFLFFIGCTVTLVGFFMAFLVINHQKREEEQRIKRQNEPKVHPYGDDTV